LGGGKIGPESSRADSNSLLSSGRFESGKHLIYTVIAGDYDSLKRPLWRPKNVDYHAFVSGPVHPTKRGWKLFRLPESISDAKLLNRRMKIRGVEFEEHYDSITYVDGSIQIIGSLELTIARFLESGGALGLFQHHDRNNPWDELAACKKLGYLSDSEARFEAARLQRFKDARVSLPLFDAGVILKNPQKKALAKISGRWFELFIQNPIRDQLSLPIVVREHDQAVFQLEHWRKSHTPTFLRHPHKASGRVIKSLFWLGSVRPRLFQKVSKGAQSLRQWLAEKIVLG